MTLKISTETEAWKTLEDLLTGQLKIVDPTDIEFGDWCSIKFYVPEDRYDSALNVQMMQGWISAQRALYRSYALIAKGESDGRSLTEKEKQALELIVEVHSGSSDQEVNIFEIVQTLGMSAVDKMSDEQIVIVIISFALIWAGVTITKSWIEKLRDQKADEAKSADIREALNTITQMHSDESANIKTLAEAFRAVPQLKQLEEEAAIGKEGLLKAAASTGATLNGVEVTSSQAFALSKTTRQTSEEQRADGIYRIERVDANVDTGFRVFLAPTDGSEGFSAEVQEIMSSIEDRNIIRDAEWSKVPVRLQINAKVRNGKIFDAIILRADRYEE
ncbi:hypothetical protein [Marivivens donghaensis]|jgi:hypothetical protein|uniref:hypothetical protein n=1 Tax=Marivivens donghaensis TaxID=1699413 RepID=UPI003F69BC35